MRIAFLVFTNLLSIIVILLMMKYGFGTKFRLDLKRIGIIAIVFFVYDFALELFFSGWMEALGIYLFMLIIMFATMPKKSMRTIFYLIPAILFYVQIDSLVKLVSHYLDIDKYTISVGDFSVEIVRLLADIVWIICLVRLGLQIEEKKLELHITAGEAVCLTLFCIFFPFYEIVYERLEMEYGSTIYSSGTKMAWVVFSVVLNIAVILLLWNKKKMKYYRDLSQVYEKYYKLEYEQFQNYKESQNEMDRFRHDLNNHFLVLKDMLLNKQYDKASAYMERLSENRDTKYYPVLTGNEMTDMIIKMKYQQIMENHINFHFSGDLSPISYVEPMDICIIFANALDNAIEACEAVSQNPFIEMAVKDFSNYILISITNSVSSDKGREKIFFRTGKKNKALHGFGVHNIRMALARNNGELDYKQKGNTLATRIIFRKPDDHPSESNHSSSELT